MVREFTCIICPNGCEITAELEKTEDGACRIRSIEGAACPRGKAYVEQELTDPRRNIATSISVESCPLQVSASRPPYQRQGSLTPWKKSADAASLHQ